MDADVAAPVIILAALAASFLCRVRKSSRAGNETKAGNVQRFMGRLRCRMYMRLLRICHASALGCPSAFDNK